MSKKSFIKKRRLMHMLRQGRDRLPLLVMLRKHRRVYYNIFARDWKHQKLRIKE